MGIMVTPVYMPAEASFSMALKRSEGSVAPGSVIRARVSSEVVTVKLTAAYDFPDISDSMSLSRATRPLLVITCTGNLCLAMISRALRVSLCRFSQGM